MEKYQKVIIDAVSKLFPGEQVNITIPPNPKMGDLALPCFTLIKKYNKNPQQIAEGISIIDNGNYIERYEVCGAFINFFLNRQVLIKEILDEVRGKKDSYGSSFLGRDKTALVEHTSINPNASPHVGRARNAMIGDSIVRLLRFEDYTVNTQYFINDVGKQIAMLVLGASDRESISFNQLLDIYIDINQRMEKDNELEKKVFDLLSKFERGDQEVRDKFKEIVDICIKGQTDILYEIGIKYDTFQYESEYIFKKRTDEILSKLKDTGRLHEDSEGRLVLNEEGYNLLEQSQHLVLTRGDKTSLYPLRDIAYTIDKMETNSGQNIVVLGEDQKLYFQQIAAALQILGYKYPSPIHYSFVLLTDGKMSTRKGTVVLLEDFMREAVLKVKEYMKNNDKESNEAIAKAIAYGAVKYAILKVDNDKNVIFDLESALSFEGDTGPYIQYSYARINSILKKSSTVPLEDTDITVLKEEIEYELAKELCNFQFAVKKALTDYSPNIIANYVYRLAKKFSSFYHECPVLNAEDEGVKAARLILLDAVKQVIKNALGLLGIDVVEYM